MGDILCPSATCAPGVSLIGTLGADGRIKHLRTPLKIDADFVETVQARGEPEAHFRFSTQCVEGHCSHWTGAACGLIETILDRVEAEASVLKADAVPSCPIRSQCRWYAQEGRSACMVCDLVVRQPGA